MGFGTIEFEYAVSSRVGLGFIMARFNSIGNMEVK